MTSVIIAAGFYISEQKTTISKQDRTIQELLVSQRPPITPYRIKTKIKYIDRIVKKTVTKKDEICTKELKDLKSKTLQCAYNLQFCQKSSEIYDNLNGKSK